MFENSFFFIALRNSKIVGSVKVTRWNENIILPIQRLFNINPEIFKKAGAKSVWHIGRFVISKSEKDGASLLKKLIAFAICPICIDSGGIMLAECDSKFVRGLNLLGIETNVLAAGITYLGSETLPIYSTSKSLAYYFNKSLYMDEAVNFYRQTHTKTKLQASYLHNALPYTNYQFPKITESMSRQFKSISTNKFSLDNLGDRFIEGLLMD